MNPSMESLCLSFRDIPQTSKIFSTFLEDFRRVGKYYGHAPSIGGVVAAAKEEFAEHGGGELAARHIDIIGAGFFQRQTDEFAAPLDLRPVVKLVTHSRHPCSISQASTAPTAIQHRETEKTLIQPSKRIKVPSKQSPIRH